jgi:hypothetical protein
MWGSDLHLITHEILTSRVEIFISDLHLCHMVVFLIYKISFIRNC